MVISLIAILNTLLLLLTLFICLRLYTLSVRYNKNPGDGDLQTRIKWKLLRGIIYLLVIALGAAALNLLTGLLSQ